MRFFIVILLGLLNVDTIQAREPKYFHIFKDRNYLTAQPVGLENADTLDTAIFTAVYKFGYQKDGWDKFNWSNECMLLQAGVRYSKFHPTVLHEIDSVFTANRNDIATRSAVYPTLWTSYYDKDSETMQAVHRIPFLNEYLVSYKEKLPHIDWTPLQETEEVIGYAAQKAVGVFRGRTWTVWFTTEIPINTYVWNLGGLPGLILKAETERFRINCISINHANNPIIRPVWRYKTLTREKWRRLEQNYHETPYAFFSNNGEHAFYDGMVKLTIENWVIPYNPIELE